MVTIQMLFIYFTMISAFMLPALGELSPDFYDEVCPQALLTIKLMVEQAIALEPRMGASLVRLHFHDCFVNGCDGSILLDDTATFIGEKMGRPNNNSVRGFELIDQIKAAVNEACQGNVVSCADILAVAARDSVVALGGSCYDVLLGRRDATTASRDAANANIPSPFLDLPDLVANFKSHGLSVEDLVILSGAHTLGFSRCLVFRNRAYNETTSINGDFAAALQAVCPVSGQDNNLAPLDESPASFDTAYYHGLVESRGLLHSDQQLFKGDGSLTDELVQNYMDNPDAFLADFGAAMIRMGNISPLTGCDGEIRENCRVVNGD